MSKTRRVGSTTRRSPFRKSATRLLIFCGGKTERQYFTGLRLWAQNPAAVVKVKPACPDPLELVAIAARQSRRIDYDEVWCVCDVDQYKLDTALARARQSGVRVALSNPCFEVWLLLHHEDYRREEHRCDDVKARLTRHVPGYNKSVDFALYQPGLAAAIRRGRALAAAGEYPNPSSGAWELAAKIIRSDMEIQ